MLQLLFFIGNKWRFCSAKVFRLFLKLPFGFDFFAAIVAVSTILLVSGLSKSMSYRYLRSFILKQKNEEYIGFFFVCCCASCPIACS
jgi:hypothetical protein